MGVYCLSECGDLLRLAVTVRRASPEKARTNVLSFRRKQQHFRAFFDRKGQILVLIPGFGFDSV